MRTVHTTRAVAGISAAVLTVTLAACSGGEGDEDAGGATDESVPESELEDHMVGAMEDYDVGTSFEATEPVEFSILYRDHPNYPVQDDWSFFEHVEQDRNVTFDRVNVPLSDWEQRRSLLVGAGDAPEIIPVTYPGDETQFVAGGAILPVSDYLDYLPNFAAKVEEWGLQDDIDNLRQEDGKFYLLPGLHEQAKPQYSIAIRSDLFEEAGITEDPQTWDEFAEQLRTVQEAHPELDYPFSDRWSLNGPIEATLQTAAPNFGTQAGWGYGEGFWFDEDAGEFVYTGATDQYRSLVEYFAGLVDEGLMDPESITQDDDTAEAKFYSGQSAAIGTNDQEILRYRTSLEDAGVDGAEVRQIRVPAGPYGDYLGSGSRTESGLMISSSAAESEHFVALLQFVDWLYFSEEGLEFAKWGVEGETYTKDGNGSRTLMDNIDINGLNPGAPEALNTDYGYHNGVFMLAHGSTADLTTSMLRPEVIEFVESMNEKEELPLPPPAPMDEAEREQASLIRTALEDHVKQNTASFILGRRSLDEWDAYVSELEGLNMGQYVQLANAARERAAENFGD